MADTKKLWFSGRDGLDGGAWADLWTLKQVREFFKGNEAIAAHLPKKAFKSLHVKVCFGPEEDGRLYSWGEKQPGFQVGDIQDDHEGTYIEVDGKVVHNDLHPAGDENEVEDHDEECETCAK